ncbi:universal stress protein [Nocardia nova]|jgi:nucleotide-binding universal stress UspA family protein|uniref:universal stress protein n=1 Tax=Nocardia nova TaxID=37330 RepID=UPI0025B2240A|nr:universal stress protein [Nocardia nova]
MAEHTDSRSHRSDSSVVAAVDGSAVSYHAAGWAGAEAALHGRRLELVTSVNVPPGWGPGAGFTGDESDWLGKDGERILAEATRIAGLAAPELPDITTTVSFDPIIPDLLARSRRARLVVVGSRGRGALRRGLLGSVSTSLTRQRALSGSGDSVLVGDRSGFGAQAGTGRRRRQRARRACPGMGLRGSRAA